MSAEITPNEILQKKFSQSLRGYKLEEVEDFLKLVAEDFELLLRENVSLEDRLKILEAAVAEYREMENTLKNTLISSQRVGQEIKEEAERKGNLLVGEAKLESEHLIQKAHKRKDRLEEETFQLLTQHKRFRAEFAALIEAHAKMLKTQDSRVLLGYEPEYQGNTPPEREVEPVTNLEPDIEAEPETEPSRERPIEQPSDGEEPVDGKEEIEDLEILFPEEKE